jgi:hypothetical protein
MSVSHGTTPLSFDIAAFTVKMLELMSTTPALMVHFAGVLW